MIKCAVKINFLNIFKFKFTFMTFIIVYTCQLLCLPLPGRNTGCLFLFMCSSEFLESFGGSTTVSGLLE